MKTLISVFFCALAMPAAAHAGLSFECDSAAKVLKEMNKSSNAYVNKYKAKMEARMAKTQSIIPRNGGDTTQAKNVISSFEKDTAYFKQCLDTARNFILAIKNREELLRKDCGKEMGKNIVGIFEQDEKTIDYLNAFISWAEDAVNQSTKGLKSVRKEYEKMVKAARKN